MSAGAFKLLTDCLKEDHWGYPPNTLLGYQVRINPAYANAVRLYAGQEGEAPYATLFLVPSEVELAEAHLCSGA